MAAPSGRPEWGVSSRWEGAGAQLSLHAPPRCLSGMSVNRGIFGHTEGEDSSPADAPHGELEDAFTRR